METLQIQVPTDLFQRLRPYQDDLVRLLELGLHYLEQKPTKLQPFDLAEFKKSEEYQQQKQLHQLLQENGITTPNVDSRLEYIMHQNNQNWQPIPISGKPVSQIIIEQRQGILTDE